jgi:hypothetical protein
MATILGGPNSRREAKVLAPSRLRRLHRHIGAEAWQLPSLSEGEVLALSWACEISALVRATASGGRRTLRVNFDQFLANPGPLLSAVLCHFDIEATANEVRAIVEGPEMRRYSKAPEHSYDAALRRDVLDLARATHGAEIRRGLAWLDRAAAQYPAVCQATKYAE